MRILKFLLKKEIKQFFRDPFLSRFIFIYPVVMMCVIPWMMTMEVKNIDLVIVDNDNSALSQRIVSKVSASDYFTLVGVSGSYESALKQLESGKADAVAEIPAHFQSLLAKGKESALNTVANGVNPTKGSLGLQYYMGMVGSAVGEFMTEEGLQIPLSDISVKYLYNPTLNYRYYMVPAIMIILLILVCGVFVALNLVNEKERGTIEQINVTPVSRLAFTLAKIIPYLIMGMVVLALSMIVAWLMYGLSPSGSIWAILLATFLFAVIMNGLGVTIANFCDNMLQAILMIYFVFIIFIMMTGLLTPVDSMPGWAYYFSFFLPPRYFIDIFRAVYLKGVGIPDLWSQFLALAGFAILFAVLATVTYKKRV